jgi:hypothetical protein
MLLGSCGSGSCASGGGGSYWCVPQSGSAELTGQGNRLRPVPSSFEVHTLKSPASGGRPGGVGVPGLDRQRNTIRLPSGDQLPLSAPVFRWRWRRPVPSGWIVASVALRSARVLGGQESP